MGPHSWKKFLFPPRLRLWSADKTGGGAFEVTPETQSTPQYAFLGVRPCELQAIRVQDQVFKGDYPDPVYAERRKQAFIIAVSCVEAGGTCFCTSMKSGPDFHGTGFDLGMTELIQDTRHDLLLQPGSERGEQLLKHLPLTPATEADLERAEVGHAQARAQMGRSLNRVGLHDLLQDHPDHPHWEQVASRCLSCGNSTMVCPTCFCHTVEDHTDLSGDHAERTRIWDSCFSLNFSYLGGGQVRHTTRSRYRQWMTHKLSTWEDQFGVSGCVGCGRCITWCPVGIDITQEADAMREFRYETPNLWEGT